MKPNTLHHLRAGLVACGAVVIMSTLACKGNEGAAKQGVNTDNNRANPGELPTAPAPAEEILFPVALEVTEQDALAAIKNAIVAPFPKAVAALAADAKLEAEVVTSAANPTLVSVWQLGPATMVALVGVAGAECAACGKHLFETSMAQQDGTWTLRAVRYLDELGSYGNAPGKAEFRHANTHRAWFISDTTSKGGIIHKYMLVYTAAHGSPRFSEALAVLVGYSNSGAVEADDPSNVDWTSEVTVEQDLGVTLAFKDQTGKAPGKAPAKASAPLTIVFDAAKAAYDVAKLPSGLRLDTDFGEPGWVVPTHPRFAM